MNESLEQLSAAFTKWRAQKKDRRDKTPRELLVLARRAVKAYGVQQVAAAATLDVRRLRKAPGSGSIAEAVPQYTKVEFTGAPRVFAEVEMANGVKVRLFGETPAAMTLLSAVCAAGGAQ